MSARDVTVHLKDGSIEVISGVPANVSDAEVEARVNGAYPSFVAKDVAKSGYTGAVQGVTGQAPAVVPGLGMLPIGMALKELAANGPQWIKDRLGRLSKAPEAAAEAANETLGATHKPETMAGRFAAAGASGLTSTLAGGSKAPLDLALGIASGLSSQGASELGLGHAGEVVASLAPNVAAALLRRARGLQPAERVAQDTMRGPSFEAEQKAWVDAAQRRRVAEAQGVPLLPGQSFGADHPIAGLTEYVSGMTHGGPMLQDKLRRQAGPANSVIEGMRSSLPTVPGQQLTDTAVDAAKRAPPPAPTFEGGTVQPPTETPTSLLAASRRGANPSILAQALDTKRFSPEAIRETLKAADGNTGTFSRGLLAERMDSAVEAARRETQGTSRAGSAPSLFAQSMQDGKRGLTEALLDRIYGPGSGGKADFQEKLSTLEATGIGRGQIGKMQPGDVKGANDIYPVLARAGGTNMFLAMVPPLRARTERIQEKRLAGALSDPEELARLLARDPNRELLQNIIRSVTVAQGQNDLSK